MSACFGDYIMYYICPCMQLQRARGSKKQTCQAKAYMLELYAIAEPLRKENIVEQIIQALLCKCRIFYAFSQHVPTIQRNFQVLVAGRT